MASSRSRTRLEGSSKPSKRRAPERVRGEIEAQRAANRSTATFAALFAEHRRRLTERIASRTPEGSEQRLCLLGAGNCHDVDLERLTRHFARIHLVDLDAAALKLAVVRQPAHVQERLVRHAPLDVGGTLDKLDRWKRLEVTPEELLRHPSATADGVARRVGGPFDVVASTCMLTQLQLAVLTALGDAHPLFRAVTQTLTLTHLKTLGRLTTPGGRALLATELVSSETSSLDASASPAQLAERFDQCLAEHDVIAVSHPALLTGTLRDDPELSRDLVVSDERGIWLWQQGPERLFLVYTLELDAKSA